MAPRRSLLLLPSIVCALAVHALVYRSVAPPGHGYFTWYEPLVGGLSLVALTLIGAVAAAALLGREGGRGRRLVRFLPATGPRTAARLAGASVAVLLVQESLERSLQARTPLVAAFAPWTWCLIVAAAFAFASLLVLASRACASVVEHALRGERPAPRAAPVAAVVRADLLPRRRKPLADRRALRAPPHPAV
jgi:hypothetical protein